MQGWHCWKGQVRTQFETTTGFRVFRLPLEVNNWTHTVSSIMAVIHCFLKNPMPEFKWAPKLIRKIVSIWDFYWLHAKQARAYIQQNTDQKKPPALFCWEFCVLEYGLCSCIGNSVCVCVGGGGVKFTPIPVNEPLFSTAWVLQAGNFVCLKWRERNGVPDRKIARICFESPNGSQNHTCLGKHWVLQLVLVCAQSQVIFWGLHFYLNYLPDYFTSTPPLSIQSKFHSDQAQSDQLEGLHEGF